MDYKKILERTWHIIWIYRALWIFGLILAMTVGGTANLSSYRSNSQRTNPSSFQGTYNLPWDSQTFNDPQSFLRSMEKVGQQLSSTLPDRNAVNALIGFVVAFFLIAILLSVGMTILRYVSATAVIKMVDSYETNGEKLTWRQGFKIGWSRPAWRLFLIDLLICVIPALIFCVLLFLLIFGAVYYVVNNPFGSSQIVMSAILAGLVFLVSIVFMIFFIFISLMQNLIGRVCVLEDKGVGESIRGGISLFRKNWKQVGLFWLIMLGLGIAWAIGSVLLALILIPVIVVTLLAGAVLGSIPGTLVGLISTIFLTGYWPVVIGILFGLPLFITVGMLPLFMVQAFAMLYRFISWTLVFRELQTPQAVPEPLELPAAS